MNALTKNQDHVANIIREVHQNREQNQTTVLDLRSPISQSKSLRHPLQSTTKTQPTTQNQAIENL
jgi:hypothetical protein